MLTLVQKNGSHPAVSPTPWLQSSVKQFFAGFNWEDNPPEVQELKLTSIQSNGAPLSMTLSVKQFFGAIAWDGNSIGASPTPTQPASPSKEAPINFTLDDFSDLF